LADDFGLGALEFFFGEALSAEQFRFAEQLPLDQVGFFRRGAGIKSKEAGHQPNDILRSYVVGQPQFLANPQEEARTQVAAGFLQELERIPIRLAESRSLKTQD